MRLNSVGFGTATCIKICSVLPHQVQYKTSSIFKNLVYKFPYLIKCTFLHLKLNFFIGGMGFEPRVAPVDGVAKRLCVYLEKSAYLDNGIIQLSYW